MGGEPERAIPSKEDARTEESSPAEPEAEFVSGRAVGEYVPTFYSRVVTGPFMNRSVCYVCRNGRRPVVMVFLRKLSPEVKPLLKQLDTLVDRHRAEGLRSFGVYVSDDPSNAISGVQTFSFDHKIRLPLTVASLAVGEPTCQNLSAEAEVTVVLYEERRVTHRFAFRAGEIGPVEIEHIRRSIEKLLKTDPEPGR